MSDLINKLQWRYATKKFNPAKAVPQEKIERILEAIRLTATSSGLQPYEVIVVSNPELRAQIQPHAWNQAQIVEASHLLVFAAWDNYTADRINMMFDLVNDVRGFKNEGWENYRQQVLGSYVPRDAETNYQHAARQAYIGLGTRADRRRGRGRGQHPDGRLRPGKGRRNPRPQGARSALGDHPAAGPIVPTKVTGWQT